MRERIAILGAGAFGTACGIILARDAGQEVRLWVRDPKLAAAIDKGRVNESRLPEMTIPESVRVSSDAEAVLQDATLILLAIPSKFLAEALAPLSGLVARDVPVVSGVKGIEPIGFRRPSELVREYWGERPIVALGGPAHAEEFARRLPTSVVAAGELELAERVQSGFSTDRFRVYTNEDLLGVEMAGALKNIMGIAAGISDGLGFGDNAKSALMTRAVVEIARFGESYGADPATFIGLAGMGDLITTCVSPFGRNRRVGMRLGAGESLEQILADMPAVAEGITTARSVDRLSIERGIEMPITRAVTAVLFENKPPVEATEDLMLRPPKAEVWGS